MKTKTRRYELHLVTVLAALVMVGAWSYAQQREATAPPLPTFALTSQISGQTSFGADAALAFLGNASQGGSSPTADVYRIEYEEILDPSDPNAADTPPINGVVVIDAFPRAANPNPGSLTPVAPQLNLSGTVTLSNFAPVPAIVTYAWPTESLGANVLIGCLLVVGTVLVVERLARRRLRTTLAELLLAVTAAGVGLALVRNYWLATGLAETAIAVRVVLIAGAYACLLAVAWIVFAAIQQGVRLARR